MKERPIWNIALLGFAAIAIGLLPACDRNPGGGAAALVPREVVFQRDVQPILEIECLQCHNQEDAAQNGGLSLETRALAFTTGRNDPVIVPGNADGSLLVKVLQFEGDHPMSMPPAPDKIWGQRLDIIRQWIDEGAAWPDDVRLNRPQDWNP